MGRIGSEHLQELKDQLVGAALGISLDLDHVSLVNVDAVRFLGECEAGGVKILHSSPYIWEWIRREMDREKR
jgi:hypothetical protein